MILIVTSFFPYRHAENWIFPELKELSELGRFGVLARSSSGSPTHSLPSNIQEIKEPLLGVVGIVACVLNPRLLLTLVQITAKHSNGIFDFLKRVLMIPKGLACAQKAKAMGVKHVHVHTTSSAASLGLIVAEVAQVDFSFTVHTSTQFNNRFRRNYAGLIDRCAFVRTISDLTKRELREFVPGEYPIHTVRMGVDLDSTENFYRSKNYEAPRILIAAALEDYKGIDVAILGVKEALKLFPEIRVDIFGQGSKRKLLEDLIEKNCLGKVIKLHGPVAHRKLLELMADPKLYNYLLLTSNKYVNGQVEGVPVVIMEAIANGIIPIVVKNGAVHEIVDETCAVIIENPCASEVAVGLTDALSLPLKSKRLLSFQGEKVLADRYHAKKNASTLYDLLKR